MQRTRGIGIPWHIAAATVAMCAWLAVPGATQQTPAASGTGTSAAAAPAIPANLADKPVTLDLNGGKLTDAVRQMMNAVQTDFTIDSALNDATASVHLTAVRFHVALDTVLKVSSIPVTYRVEKGVFRFLPKTEPATQPETNTDPSPSAGPQVHVATIKLKNVNATTVKETLDEDPDYRDYRLQYQGSPTGGFSNGSMTGRSDYSGYGFVNGRYYRYNCSTADPGAANGTSTRAQAFGSWLSLLNGNLHFGVSTGHR